MFLRKTQRKKDGKTHDYWSVVENKRVAGGRVVQRHVLYLGEINSSQAAVWRKAIEVLDDDAGHPRTLALFREDRCAAVASDASVVQLRLSEMRLCRPRQWGACWLAGQLWQALQLDRFWADRLPPSRKGTQWDQVLQVLVSYRLIAPGSEWKLHREWFGKSAMADLLEADFGLAEAHKLYACHDLLLRHKADLFSHLMARWRDLFGANFDVLLYDLTSTYFEINASEVAEGDKRRHGYSRDKRPDCPQVVIALVVTTDGLPLAYEVLPGNTADCTTLRMFLARIERQYGRARRVWVMDRGIPTEAVLAEMRGSDPPVQYLVGTPKGRLSRLEKQLEMSGLSNADLQRLVLKLLSENAEQKRAIAELREEIARLKGLKGRPDIKPSGMETGPAPRSRVKRAGRRGRGAVTPRVSIEEMILPAAVPPGSRFKGYEDFVVQDVVLRVRAIRYRRERWVTPDGRTVIAPLPRGVTGHFGPELHRFVLAQYHQGQVTVPRLVEQLRTIGVAISKRQVMRLLIAGQDEFLAEAQEVLRAGLQTASWITVDDTGARHKATNGFCTQIGNESFAWFGTTNSKSRLNFLDLLRAGHTDYVINDAALSRVGA